MKHDGIVFTFEVDVLKKKTLGKISKVYEKARQFILHDKPYNQEETHEFTGLKRLITLVYVLISNTGKLKVKKISSLNFPFIEFNNSFYALE